MACGVTRQSTSLVLQPSLALPVPGHEQGLAVPLHWPTARFSFAPEVGGGTQASVRTQILVSDTRCPAILAEQPAE